MRLSEHFYLDEFEHSETASRLDIDNHVPEELVHKLKFLCETVLEPLREELGKPIHINSGYRSPRLNEHIPGSAKSSQHTKGEAADITVAGLSAQEVFVTICRLNLPFDQIIQEGTWVHVSAREGANRGERLWATFKKAKGVVRASYFSLPLLCLLLLAGCGGSTTVVREQVTRRDTVIAVKPTRISDVLPVLVQSDTIVEAVAFGPAEDTAIAVKYYPQARLFKVDVQPPATETHVDVERIESHASITPPGPSFFDKLARLGDALLEIAFIAGVLAIGIVLYGFIRRNRAS